MPEPFATIEQLVEQFERESNAHHKTNPIRAEVLLEVSGRLRGWMKHSPAYYALPATIDERDFACAILALDLVENIGAERAGRMGDNHRRLARRLEKHGRQYELAAAAIRDAILLGRKTLAS